MREHLDRVLECLPLAAYRHTETPEHVHQLRVATRRVLATLRLYAPVLPIKESQWIAKQMRRIRSAAGTARDLDVLMSRYRSRGRKNQTVLRHLKRQRREAQHSICQLCESLMETSKLPRHCRRLLKKSSACSEGQPLHVFAAIQLQSQAASFFAAAPAGRTTVTRLHRFRIEAKRFRYAIELIGDCFPGPLNAQIYPSVCKTQDLLGAVNDRSVALRRMKALLRQAEKKKVRKRLKALITKERRHLKRCRNRFQKWWTPSFASELEANVADLLSTPPNEDGAARDQ